MRGIKFHIGPWLIVTPFLAVLAGSCEQDLITSAPGRSLPVVYSLINPKDTLHFIRIGRTFKGEDNALDLARCSDSITLDVTGPKIEFFTRDGWKYNELLFSPVVDYVKEDGRFATDGSQLYQCRAPIADFFLPGTRLLLSLTAGQQQDPLTAIIEYVPPPRILAPRSGLSTTLDFYPDPIEFSINDPPEFVRYEFHALLHVASILENGDTIRQTVDKRFVRNSGNTSLPRDYQGITVYVSGDLLLAQVRQDIKPDPAVAWRVVTGFELALHTGSREFYDYIDLNAMADDYGGRITTNINGGIGLFALRYESKVPNLRLGFRSLDSIANGRFTRHLKFKNY